MKFEPEFYKGDEPPTEGTLEDELTKAWEHAKAALDIVYQGNSPTRKWLWRLRLLRAESLLMRLMLSERSKRDNGLPKPVTSNPMTRQS